MSIFDDIRRDVEAGTPGPWTGHNMVHAEGRSMTPEEIGEYVCNSVKIGIPDRFLFISAPHPDGDTVDVCHTGNGPRGTANTARIARVPELERIALAAEELAAAVDHERNMVCQDFGMQLQANNRVDAALAKLREATA